MNNADAFVRNRRMSPGRVASLIEKFELLRPEPSNGRVVSGWSIAGRGYAAAGTRSSVCESCGQTRWSSRLVLEDYENRIRGRGWDADVNRPATAFVDDIVSCREVPRGVGRATGRLERVIRHRELEQCPVAVVTVVIPSPNTFVPPTLKSHPNFYLLRNKNIHSCLIPGNVRRLIELFERI